VFVHPRRQIPVVAARKEGVDLARLCGEGLPPRIDAAQRARAKLHLRAIRGINKQPAHGHSMADCASIRNAIAGQPVASMRSATS
jgi:hypothetical protein